MLYSSNRYSALLKSEIILKIYVYEVHVYIGNVTSMSWWFGYTLYTSYEDLQREGVVVEHDEGYVCLFFFKKD